MARLSLIPGGKASRGFDKCNDWHGHRKCRRHVFQIHFALEVLSIVHHGDLNKQISINIMKKNLTRIAPLRAGIVLGILYGIFSLIFVPFFLLAALIGSKSGNPAPAMFGMGFAVCMPVLYGVLGFIGGVIMAALYNLIARWTGGLEFEVRDVQPSA
jgi:hypothetical protein